MVSRDNNLDPLFTRSTVIANMVPIIAENRAVQKENINVLTTISNGDKIEN